MCDVKKIPYTYCCLDRKLSLCQTFVQPQQSSRPGRYLILSIRKIQDDEWCTVVGTSGLFCSLDVKRTFCDFKSLGCRLPMSRGNHCCVASSTSLFAANRTSRSQLATDGARTVRWNLALWFWFCKIISLKFHIVLLVPDAHGATDTRPQKTKSATHTKRISLSKHSLKASF